MSINVNWDKVNSSTWDAGASALRVLSIDVIPERWYVRALRWLGVLGPRTEFPVTYRFETVTPVPSDVAADTPGARWGRRV